ncbi:MAG: hypothetical protein Q7S40_25865 [Opitutaceae bacterium]|nr:hypothetical protein [Opitutaceae bacterium]
MTLAEFTQANLCLPSLRGRDPAAVLSELSRALEREHLVPASLSLFNVALNQYFFANGDTIGAAAYSLGRLASLHTTAFAVGQAREQFWWRNGCASVYLVFLIASPPNDSQTESAIIGGVKRLVDDRVTLQMIHSATRPATMFAALSRITLSDVNVSSPRTAATASAVKSA